MEMMNLILDSLTRYATTGLVVCVTGVVAIYLRIVWLQKMYGESYIRYVEDLCKKKNANKKTKWYIVAAKFIGWPIWIVSYVIDAMKVEVDFRKEKNL